MMWSSGEIPYEQVPDTLNNVLTNAIKIYVKGVQKREWLRNIFPNKYAHYNLLNLFISQFTN